ncbi:hypothetical protein IFR05_000398 [Cadophora sp. M221]|nr:hypothetical protein IFR05_000398 [Cadophora sp. M221]
MSYLRLATALKTLTQKASHPSDLIYKIQLARAKEQQLDRGEIGDGKTGVIGLAAPEELKGEQKDVNEGSIDGAGDDGEGYPGQRAEPAGRGETKDIGA